jgi:hypothetical protein
MLAAMIVASMTLGLAEALQRDRLNGGLFVLGKEGMCIEGVE